MPVYGNEKVKCSLLLYRLLDSLMRDVGVPSSILETDGKRIGTSASCGPAQCPTAVGIVNQVDIVAMPRQEPLNLES